MAVRRSRGRPPFFTCLGLLLVLFLLGLVLALVFVFAENSLLHGVAEIIVTLVELAYLDMSLLFNPLPMSHGKYHPDNDQYCHHYCNGFGQEQAVFS